MKRGKRMGLLSLSLAVTLLLSFLIFLPSRNKPFLSNPDEGISSSGDKLLFVPLEEGESGNSPENPSETLDSDSAVSSGSSGSSMTSESYQKELRLSFVGDCMLATIHGWNGMDTLNYEMDRQDPTFFFQYVSSYFLEDDFTVANCENVFTDRNLPAVAKNYSPAYWYRSAAKNAGIFKVAGIDAVSICNNHAGDYGKDGYADTLEALSAVGIPCGESGKPLYFEKYGLRIGLICANLYGSGQTEGILRQVRALREDCGYVIVYFHGGRERIHAPEEWKIDACRRIAEEGADLILGCHPHVLQPMEQYTRQDGKSSLIVYSMGNFLFGGGRNEENRTAVFRLSLTVEEGEVISQSMEAIPCYVYATADHASPECWIPKPIEEGEIRENVLAFLRGERETPK